MNMLILGALLEKCRYVVPIYCVKFEMFIAKTYLLFFCHKCFTFFLTCHKCSVFFFLFAVIFVYVVMFNSLELINFSMVCKKILKFHVMTIL